MTDLDEAFGFSHVINKISHSKKLVVGKFKLFYFFSKGERNENEKNRGEKLKGNDRDCEKHYKVFFLSFFISPSVRHNFIFQCFHVYGSSLIFLSFAVVNFFSSFSFCWDLLFFFLNSCSSFPYSFLKSFCCFIFFFRFFYYGTGTYFMQLEFFLFFYYSKLNLEKNLIRILLNNTYPGL